MFRGAPGGTKRGFSCLLAPERQFPQRLDGRGLVARRTAGGNTVYTTLCRVLDAEGWNDPTQLRVAMASYVMARPGLLIQPSRSHGAQPGITVKDLIRAEYDSTVPEYAMRVMQGQVGGMVEVQVVLAMCPQEVYIYIRI
jgi:hypothetical protein